MKVPPVSSRYRVESSRPLCCRLPPLTGQFGVDRRQAAFIGRELEYAMMTIATDIQAGLVAVRLQQRLAHRHQAWQASRSRQDRDVGGQAAGCQTQAGYPIRHLDELRGRELPCRQNRAVDPRNGCRRLGRERLHDPALQITQIVGPRRQQGIVAGLQAFNLALQRQEPGPPGAVPAGDFRLGRCAQIGIVQPGAVGFEDFRLVFSALRPGVFHRLGQRGVGIGHGLRQRLALPLGILPFVRHMR